VCMSRLHLSFDGVNANINASDILLSTVEYYTGITIVLATVILLLQKTEV
jgi:hypothetical protein